MALLLLNYYQVFFAPANALIFSLQLPPMYRLLPAPRLRLQLPLPRTSPPVPLAPPSLLSTLLAAAPAPVETAPFLL